MIRDVKKHKTAYFILTIFLVIFVLLFMNFWPNRYLQRMVAVSMGVFYFVWGFVVHKRHNHINSKVIFEYLAISTLGVSLLLLILN